MKIFNFEEFLEINKNNFILIDKLIETKKNRDYGLFIFFLFFTGLGLAILLFWLGFYIEKQSPVSILISIIFFLFINYLFYRFLNRILVRPIENKIILDYKKSIFSKLLENSSQRIRLDVNSLSEFEKRWKIKGVIHDSELFSKYHALNPFNKFIIEDILEGTIDKDPILVSKINLEFQITAYNSASGLGIHKHELIFTGFFVKLSEIVDSKIIIQIDEIKNSTFFNKIKFKLNNVELIKTKSLDFNERFNIFTNDFQITSTIISEKFILEYEKLISNIGASVSISIIDGNVYIAYQDPFKYFTLNDQFSIEQQTQNHFYDIEKIYLNISLLKDFISHYFIEKIVLNNSKM
jgi:hypothetical protein